MNNFKFIKMDTLTKKRLELKLDCFNSQWCPMKGMETKRLSQNSNQLACRAFAKLGGKKNIVRFLRFSKYKIKAFVNSSDKFQNLNDLNEYNTSSNSPIDQFRFDGSFKSLQCDIAYVGLLFMYSSLL